MATNEHWNMPNVDLDKKKMFKTLKANLSDQKSSIWLQKVFLNDFKIKKKKKNL